MSRIRPNVPYITRYRVLFRAKSRCEACERHENECGKLTLHHLHYETEGREHPDDLRALCWDCHKAAHRDADGNYWRDPQEMQWLGEAIEEAFSKID